MGNKVALNKAVVLDRDGTIALDVPYCRRPEDFNLFPEVTKAIAVLNNGGFKVVVVTNQSGLARGYFTEETLWQIHHKMEVELSRHNVKVDAIYYCPHRPDDGCDCRKPNIALFLKACEDINIDYKSSYVIGDMELDIIVGKKMGCKTVLINHGNGNSVRHTTKPDYVASDMLDAANWILSNG